MKNPCNDIKVGRNTISSYNAGYHRGLNTEYHDIPVEELFAKWIADVRRPATETIDPVAFEEGFRDGIADYENWKKNEKILEDRPHKEIGNARAAKVHRVPTTDELVTAQPMTRASKIENLILTYNPREVDWGKLPPEVFEQTNPCGEIKKPFIAKSTPNKSSNFFQKMFKGEQKMRPKRTFILKSRTKKFKTEHKEKKMKILYENIYDEIPYHTKGNAELPDFYKNLSLDQKYFIDSLIDNCYNQPVEMKYQTSLVNLNTGETDEKNPQD